MTVLVAPPSSQLFLILGSGGVGKTTSAASLGLAMAEKGLSCVVITIDPAKRLAQALGLEQLSNEAKNVVKTEAGGSLDALWLDARSALSELVEKIVHDPEKARTITQNRLFNILQEQLGGIEEYLGLEKVLSLGQSGRYQVCILDTPPSRHALDFIESPRHLVRFFDESVLKKLLVEEEPSTGNIFFRLLRSGRNQALDVFRNFLGKGFITELSELLRQCRPLYDLLTATADSVETWLRREDTRIVLVSLLEPYPLEEARLLSGELQGHGLPFPAALVLNKSFPDHETPSLEALRAALGVEAGESLYRRWELQRKLRTHLETGHPIAQHLIPVPRLPSGALNRENLTRQGKDLISSWETLEPKLFSKS